MNVKEVYIYMFPGIMYVWVFFIAQGPMQEILDEKDNHTLQRLLAAPVGMAQFVLSKIVRCVLLCAAIQCLLLVVSAILFDIRWGNPWLLLTAVLACALSVTGMLALVYGVAKTKVQAYSMSSVIIVTCAMVGGSFFPFEEMPSFLQAIGRFTPNRWGIVALQTIAGFRPAVNLVLPVVFLCAIGLVGSIAAMALIGRRPVMGGTR